MAKTAYEILGIDKSADDAAVKAAYRKLAKKNHPDLNPGNKAAAETFHQIGTAYDLLSDATKRAAYDRGEIGLDGQPRQQQQFYRDHATGPQAHRYRQQSSPGRNPAPDPEEFDRNANFSDFFSQFFDHRAEASQAEADSRYAIDIEFLEAANGASKHVTLPDGRTLDLKIPAGITDGQKLRLKGQGAKRRDGTNSDALVELHINPHPRFTRSGNDVTIEVSIGLHESVLGLKAPMPTLTGTVEVAIPKGSSSGSMLRLKGKGIKGGDQMVKLKIVMPPVIDAELEAAIRKWSEGHPYDPRRGDGA